MTADELRRLAEIVGLELQYSKFEGWYWYEENYNHTPWRPHESIEQAMMVAEQYIEWSVGKTSLKEKEKLYHAYVCTSQDDDMWFRSFGKTPSEAICRAALAAAKEV